MNCRNIDTRLSQIRRTALKLRYMLASGNTGKEFHTALDVIELHLQAIRAECDTLRR